MKVKGQRRVEVVVDGVWREGGGIKKVVSLWVREEDKRTISSFDLRCEALVNVVSLGKTKETQKMSKNACVINLKLRKSQCNLLKRKTN